MNSAKIDWNARLPSVTIVIINWNYARYISEAIGSVFSQDYENIDCIVVDNGSTDNSASLVSGLIKGHPRFKLIQLNENLGQLGALISIFDQIKGDFVVLLDADDILSPTFVSRHIQVHLALPKAVAFTSANVVEVSAEGRARTGGFQAFGAPLPWDAPGLVDASRAIRIPTISEEQYSSLTNQVSSIAPWHVGWFWSPGSANMYRRSILSIICKGQPQRPYMRASDAYVNPFCQALGGSALIDQPLSFYRLHDANYFALRESLAGSHSGRAEFEGLHRKLAEETTDFILSQSERFRPLLGGERFWGVPEQISITMSGNPPEASSAFILSAARHLSKMRTALGDSELLTELPKRLRARALIPLVEAALAQRLPLGFILRLGKRMTRLFLSRLTDRLLPRTRKCATHAITPSHPLRYFPPPQGFRDFGPIAVLSQNPLIIKSGIAYDEWTGIAGAFGRHFGNCPAAFLIYPTWSIEESAKIAAIGNSAREHKKLYPDHRLVFMGNTQREADMLAAEGLTALFLNKNFTVSDKIFRPLPDVAVEFDAIYNARFVADKRYELTSEIESFAYLGYLDGSGEYEKAQQARLEQIRRERPHHVLLNPLIDGRPRRLSQTETNASLNRARVGLCLSEVEGTNYASMEYMLAGLGVVSTPSRGGRDVYFDPEYCIICEPAADAVKNAVLELKARQIPRDYIRQRTLARIKNERTRFLELVDDLRLKLGGRPEAFSEWPYGDFSGMVTWDRFEAHLQRLEGSSHAARTAATTASIVEIEKADLRGIQLEPAELAPIVNAILRLPKCRLIVFGCGNDSSFWERINCDGRTIFIEDDQEWIDKIRPRLTTAEIAKVSYETRVEKWAEQIDSGDSLKLDLPDGIEAKSWDIVLVDGPAGYAPHLPGRSQSIVTAANLVAPGGTVFVHDCERPLEKAFASRYLGEHRRTISVWGRALLNGYSF